VTEFLSLPIADKYEVLLKMIILHLQVPKESKIATRHKNQNRRQVQSEAAVFWVYPTKYSGKNMNIPVTGNKLL